MRYYVSMFILVYGIVKTENYSIILLLADVDNKKKYRVFKSLFVCMLMRNVNVLVF